MDDGGWGDRDIGVPFVSFLTVLNILVGGGDQKFPECCADGRGNLRFAICDLQLGRKIGFVSSKKGRRGSKESAFGRRWRGFGVGAVGSFWFFGILLYSGELRRRCADGN